jgi:hypothetical protein
MQYSCYKRMKAWSNPLSSDLFAVCTPYALEPVINLVRNVALVIFS